MTLFTIRVMTIYFPNLRPIEIKLTDLSKQSTFKKVSFVGRERPSFYQYSTWSVGICL